MFHPQRRTTAVYQPAPFFLIIIKDYPSLDSRIFFQTTLINDPTKLFRHRKRIEMRYSTVVCLYIREENLLWTNSQLSQAEITLLLTITTVSTLASHAIICSWFKNYLLAVFCSWGIIFRILSSVKRDHEGCIYLVPAFIDISLRCLVEINMEIDLLETLLFTTFSSSKTSNLSSVVHLYLFTRSYYSISCVPL